MHNSSVDPVNEKPHNTVDWWLGWTLVSNEVSLYSQHIKGTKNIIMDSFSRDLDPSDKYVTKIFKFVLPPHTAASFQIKPLPIYISQCIFSLPATPTRPKKSPKPLRPSSIETGTDGAHYSHTYVPRKNSWTESNMELIQPWCHHLWHECRETSLVQQIK